MYFGQNPDYQLVHGGVPWPDFLFGSIRLWGTTTTWADLEPANGSYVWDSGPDNIIDNWLNLGQANGVTDFVYTFGKGTPPWISSNPGDTFCNKVGGAATPGWCDPPSDVNADGTGTDAAFIAFVTALVQHAAGRIQTWECINEADGPSSEWTGNIAQTLRMCTDMYNTVKSIDPSAKVATPAPTGAGSSGLDGKAVSWMLSYLQAGGGNFADIIAFHGYVPETDPERVVGITQGITNDRSSNAVVSKPVWDTEMGYTVSDLPDANMQAAFLARVYLLQWSYGVSRFYWYSYGNLETGELWTPAGDNPAGVAYGVVFNWMVGSTVTSACAPNGTVWTCGFKTIKGDQVEAVWDTAQICSPCSTSNFSPGSGFTKYQDLAGNTHSISGSTVPIGAQPIWLEP